MTQPTLLPLLPAHPHGPHGSRSAMTCQFRCADACFKPMPNESDNQDFHDVVEHALRRRSLLKAGGVGLGALAVTGLSAGAPAAAAPVARPKPKPGRGRSNDVGRDAFAVVPPNNTDAVTAPAGYRSDVVISWGDPVTRKAVPFDVDAQTADTAAEQFGYNNDYVGVLPLSRNRALLVCNHEYTNENIMFPDGYDAETVKEVAMVSHGMSVVEIERGRRQGSWQRVPVRRTSRNRRLTTRTAFRLTGPAAGTERVKTTADPTGTLVYGTLNNCAGGTTPWGTVLSGEENFNQYFDGPVPTGAYAASYKRYGITGTGTRGWGTVDPRFDLAQEPNEPFRFGWIVEVDPYDPTSTPQKHTMLGRFKHEGANIALTRDGRAVAYMGDDERGDYIYKFVSAKKMKRGASRAARRHNLTLLQTGTLYVARFVAGSADEVPTAPYDGTGEWIRLADDQRSYVDGMSLEDVLIDTRLAADKVSPTKMDRPEDVEPNLVTGKVYAALTNNSDRGVKYAADEANPVATSQTRSSLGGPLTQKMGNRNGYVLEWTPTKGDHAATTFTWTLLLVCGDPEAPETYFSGVAKEDVSPISCPDNLAFDKQGNLWVSTDGNQLGSNDGLFRVPTRGRERGKVEQFLTVPVGAETCGPLISDDQRSVWVAVQHPGEKDGATFTTPASTWPSGGFPRPSVVVTYRG